MGKRRRWGGSEGCVGWGGGGGRGGGEGSVSKLQIEMLDADIDFFVAKRSFSKPLVSSFLHTRKKPAEGRQPQPSWRCREARGEGNGRQLRVGA